MQNSAQRLVFTFITVVWACSFSVRAQNITKSPYSIVGVGDVVYSGNTSTYSMGQTNQAIRNPFAINILNPASYSSTKTTNIEAGATYSLGTFTTNTSSASVNNAWIAYLNLAMPISVKKGIGVSFGLTPFSGLGYNIQSETTLPGDTAPIPALYNFVGRGGLSRFYLGYGMRLHRTTSLGLNANYLFGENTNTTQLLIPPGFRMFNTNEDKRTYINGWTYDIGLQIHDTFTRVVKNELREYEWVLGGTVTPLSNLNAEQSYLLRSLPIGSTGGTRDTTYSETGILGTIVSPLAFKAGISLARKDVWLLAADIRGTQWSDYRSFGSTDSLRNSLGGSIGGSYTPNFKGKNFFSRIEYRAGIRYEQSNLSVDGIGVDILSFNAGLGLPMAKSKSKVNIGAEWMQRGTVANGLVQENYFRVYIGVSFADKWFYRYRYD